MAKTLEDLITEADVVFLGRHVLTQHQQGTSTNRPIELLAQYLVAEMHALYGPTSSDRENLNRFISNLEFASGRLEDVIRCFRELHNKASFDEVAFSPARPIFIALATE